MFRSKPLCSTINGSERGRDRPGFGCPAVYSKLRGIQYYAFLRKEQFEELYMHAVKEPHNALVIDAPNNCK